MQTHPTSVVINQKCIRGRALDLAFARPHVTTVPPIKEVRFGDVLINSTGVGTLGRVAQVLFAPETGLAVDSHVTIVRAGPTVAHPDFLGLTLLDREPELAAMGVGSTGQTELGSSGHRGDQGRGAATAVPERVLRHRQRDPMPSRFHLLRRQRPSAQRATCFSPASSLARSTSPTSTSPCRRRLRDTAITSGRYTEDQLVEQPAIRLFEELGWEHVNAYYEKLGPDGTLGRDNKSEVFLVRRLRAAIERLNPGMPAEAVEQAVTEITKPRTAMHYARANEQIHALLRDRVEVSVRQPDGTTLPEKLTVIDWENPENNDFLLVSQFWVHSDLYHRRADLVGFVNGIPLVFIELKASHRNLKHAYDDNLRDYRDTIPHLFIPNGFLVLSNGAETKVGTITSGWEFFSEWKKINSEGEEGSVSLETVIRGMCTKERLLDLIENFVAFQDRPGGFVKLLARNHQYLGVNNALARMEELRHAPPEERGKLGVFWHTQGSGKTHVDAVLLPEGAPQGAGELVVRDRHRPRGPGRAGAQGVPLGRRRHREARPRDQRRPTCASCSPRITATSSP